ncbi:MAG: J domain-containing protein [Bacteroidetes bacterium]|nr:J domain-containing protein [Bacteroidota bacterium]
MKNYYFILQISVYARDADIKRAYRRLALLYHPDRNPSVDAAEKFREINEAYEALSDPVKKLLYDQMLTGEVSEVVVDSNPAPAHRDPRYRPRPNSAPLHNRPSARKQMLILMERHLTKAVFISKVTLICCSVLFFDFILPVSKTDERVIEIYTIGGKYGSSFKVETSKGKTYRMNSNSLTYFKTAADIQICTSPILSIPKRIETTNGYKHRLPISIYGNFIFFPIIWLITSLFGVFYKETTELQFNFGVANFLLIFFNLIIFYISK